MVGLSHSAFRSLVKKIGGVGAFYTEMLAAKRLPHDNPKLSPLLMKSFEEQPLIYQLIGGDPAHIRPAVDKIHTLGAEGIDLNLGCPAPMQKRQGAGSSLVDNPSQLRSMLQQLRKNTELPVSVKIRLGHQVDDLKLMEFCLFLEGEGVDFLTIHARLIGEKFCRKPRWHGIAPAKKAVNIPIFANGGIFSVDDAKRCLEQSGADGIMVGRGAVINPWLCREIFDSIYSSENSSLELDKKRIYYDFIDLLEDRFPPEKQLVRLKLFTNYYAKTFQFGHHLGSGVQSSETLVAAKEKAADFFATVM
ncbi:MAG: tRNA-dihydrouridine synthase family protein [Desulfobulbaceae bacterium]|nr:tRNA-dihydrouridine synthase family protein [Desulfobulbaceae bacterium]